uniref:Contactin associated protein like 3 n=1 Tax=Pundamilia nyererei TaxID=303518 RepID=A0A3B4GET7_9CICH
SQTQGMNSKPQLYLLVTEKWAYKVCDRPLVSSLPPSSFRSSSQLSTSHAPGFAKLNRRDGELCFCPQWLHVKLGLPSAVKQKGNYSFPGNSNADSVVHYKLQQPAIARFIRLIPLDWNPNGRIGLRLETYGCPYSKSLALDASMQIYSGDIMENRGSYRPLYEPLSGILSKTVKSEIILVLLSAVLFSLTPFTGRTSSTEPQRLVSLGSLLDDQHWHHVAVERRGSHLNLTVDKHTERVQIPADFSHWSIEQVFSNTERTVYDRIYNLVIATHAWFPCGEKKCSQHLSKVLMARCATMAHGKDFIFSGVLMDVCFPGASLNDGQWHSVELNSRQGRLTITVDKEERDSSQASPSFPVTVESHLFFGCPVEDGSQKCRNLFSVFQGCMRLFTVDNQNLDLIKVQEKQLGNYSNLQIDICGIIDRCSPSPCEHGGPCSQSWTVFHCNCSDSGYSGATCHSSVYEQSCEAYKHNGNTSGHFYIDVDGSGPIKPQLVYCNMTGDTTTLTAPFTTINSVNQYSIHFDYSSEEEQLLAVIKQSEHCEQELSYHCKMSRLLNTPEGSPLSWWFGGPGTGRVQTYWGGAQPGSQQCACGLQGDCVDLQHYCNCDADRMEWY